MRAAFRNVQSLGVNLDAAWCFTHVYVLQAAMVLAFMFLASWRLTVITFIMIPVIMAIVKFYGAYFR